LWKWPVFVLALNEFKCNVSFGIGVTYVLGEAYLIYAEACLSSQPDEAKKYINKIQQRAGSGSCPQRI